MKKILCSLLCAMSFTMFSGLGAYAVQVPENTSIVLNLEKTVSSNENPSGAIKAKIKDDVIIDGITVFKADDNATINIQDYEKAGAWGIGGELFLGNGYVYDVKGNKHKVLFSKKIEGKDKNWVKVTCCCGLLLWPLLLFGFVHGNPAKVTTNVDLETTTAQSFDF